MCKVVVRPSAISCESCNVQSGQVIVKLLLNGTGSFMDGLI